MPGRTPPGFDENPTAWSRRILFAALALLGLCVSAYLASFEVGALSGVWDPFFERPRMLGFLGFPDTALGAPACGTELVLTFIEVCERWRTMPWTVLAFGAVILSGPS